MTAETSEPIWLFDSKCVLCSWGVRYTLRHEKAHEIRFVAILSAEGRELAERHGVDPENPATFLFVEKGAALEKSDAALALARHLRGPASLLPLFAWMPKRWRDAIYSAIANNRYRLFGKTDVCIAPHPDHRHRFVLP